MSKMINIRDYATWTSYAKNKNYNKRNKTTKMNEKILSPMSVVQSIRADNKLQNDIAKCAELLLEAFEINASEMYVPIVEILKKLGINTYKRKMTLRKLSAYISVAPEYRYKYGTTKIACINQEDSAGHSRFALAHELAHYIFDYNEAELDQYFNTYMKDEKNKGEDERRANEFAANLLMPKEIFIQKKEYFEKETGESKPDVIASLAEHFGVSVKSIYKRLEEVKNVN